MELVALGLSSDATSLAIESGSRRALRLTSKHACAVFNFGTRWANRSIVRDTLAAIKGVIWGTLRPLRSNT